MRSTRAGTSVAAPAVGALALAAPAAVATGNPAGDVRMDIRSGNAAPGSGVTVSTTACGAETYGKGTSEAGGAFHLFEGDRKGVLVGEFVIPDGAEPGPDTVALKCPPRTKITDTYRIGDRAPTGAVAAGFGTPSDKGTQLSVGGLLPAGAVAGGAIRVRRSPTGFRA